MLKIEKVKNVAGDYEQLLFCEKAMMGKEDTRNNLKNIKIDCGIAVTTDGHRLHMAELFMDYPDGIYKVVSRDKNAFILEEDKEVTWPDYMKVFPEHKDFKEVDMYFSGYRGEKEKAAYYLSNNYTRLVREMPEDITLNISFLEDFLGNEPYTAFIYDGKNVHNQSTSPVCFRNHTKLVLVMPVRIPN
jgi:hypothetical protein